MASISPPLPMSARSITRTMQAQARFDAHFDGKNPAKQQPGLLDKILAVWSAPYKKMGGSFLRF
ncbi:hypothetical protein LT85_3749 [Collimonas arenae]|uniref:Uncharacterized protein n=2 Tax=Collimonas arenae TaxID=279058 RepID=A0A0A1FJ45_9BURK|nr:hypothetical protein LT85_3749 [Collimonas arenae]